MRSFDYFNYEFGRGRIGENQIAQWLIRAHQHKLLPAYEIEIPHGKGPRLLTEKGELVSPDFLSIKVMETTIRLRWIEAKTKSHFTWHRNSGNWQTGIDIRHYQDYIEVQRRTRIEVLILFLHRCKNPSQDDLDHGSPVECPTGLFYRPLRYLMKHEHHKDAYSDKRGRNNPMVYWNHKDLHLLATLEEVDAAIAQDKEASA